MASARHLCMTSDMNDKSPVSNKYKTIAQEIVATLYAEGQLNQIR